MLQLIQNLKTLGPVKEARHESYRFVITLFEKSKTENSGETESRLGLPGAAEGGLLGEKGSRLQPLLYKI